MWLFLRTTAMFTMVCILLGWPGVVRNSTYVLDYQDGAVRSTYRILRCYRPYFTMLFYGVGRVRYRTVLDGIVPYGTVGREGGTLPGTILRSCTVQYCTVQARYSAVPGTVR